MQCKNLSKKISRRKLGKINYVQYYFNSKLGDGKDCFTALAQPLWGGSKVLTPKGADGSYCACFWPRKGQNCIYRAIILNILSFEPWWRAYWCLGYLFTDFPGRQINDPSNGRKLLYFVPPIANATTLIRNSCANLIGDFEFWRSSQLRLKEAARSFLLRMLPLR